MKKILFVMEDYNEMLFVETVLKKIGFDCMGLQNDKSIEDKVLGFVPHLILADGFGRKLNGLLLSQRIKRAKGFPKYVLVMTPPENVSDEDKQRLNIDGIIERPIHPIKLVEIIAKILGLDFKALKLKIDKLGLFNEIEKDKLNIIKGKIKNPPAQMAKVKDSPIELSQRVEKYQKYIDELPKPATNGLPRAQVLGQVRDFREREKDSEIQEIDREREAFVKALFKR